MTKIRVLHIIGGGEIGGAENHVLSLLAALDQEKFAPILCCLAPRPLYQRARELGIEAYALDMRHKLDIHVIKSIYQLIKEKDIQILHTHGVRANLVGRLAGLRAGVPVSVTTVHSVLEYDYPGLLDRLVNSWTEKSTWRLVDRFIAVSQLLARDLQRKGVNAEKISLIYNGIPIPAEPTSPLDKGLLRQELGLEPQRPLLGVIGRLHPVKGQAVMLQAAARLVAQGREFTLLLVGEGQQRQELQNLTSELGLTGCVHFLGFRSDAAEKIMPALDMLIIPSLSEGCPLVALEAMIRKVPVIASQVGGLPELVEHGISGLLVPPGDPVELAERIVWLWERPQLGRELTEAAYLRAREKFSLDRMVADTQKVYFELLARFRKGEKDR
ncbi:glycosyltransferase family 4 protein [Carboxydocella sp. ULO1]|uniref:glycosyltransferase family 4 protein n=1 Tax=Carboxydocella sp. ULO1 TaxID=1926599 RepID=UPI0011774B69|nr:glycosyltransferase family 4 protein [Carboxydocella sp. ULO1]